MTIRWPRATCLQQAGRRQLCRIPMAAACRAEAPARAARRYPPAPQRGRASAPICPAATTALPGPGAVCRLQRGIRSGHSTRPSHLLTAARRHRSRAVASSRNGRENESLQTRSEPCCRAAHWPRSSDRASPYTPAQYPAACALIAASPRSQIRKHAPRRPDQRSASHASPFDRHPAAAIERTRRRSQY